MPLFSSKNDTSSSTDPQVKQLEKRLSADARRDQQNLDHANKDLHKAETTHHNSLKTVDKAHHALDKTVKKEYKAAAAINKAVHNHDTAVSNQHDAEKNLQLKQQHESQLDQALSRTKQTVEDLERKKDINDQQRESKLSEIHAKAASRIGSFDDPGTTPTAGRAPMNNGPSGAAA